MCLGLSRCCPPEALHELLPSGKETTHVHDRAVNIARRPTVEMCVREESMPKNVEFLTVFVSGPSDVESEKAALRTVVAELSERLMKTHGVGLRVVGWPNDVRPGVNVDPQAEINSQFGAECDIYLGILGTRFGTPTRNADSGTEEEFDQGINRLRADSRSLRVLLYFKTGPVDPFNLEIDQLQKVKEFRAGLNSRGVLYRDFKNTADFVQMVKNHLESLVSDQWGNGHWSPIPGLDEDSPRQVTATVTPSSQESHWEDKTGATDPFVDYGDDGDEGDLGLLDYMAFFHKENSAMSLTLERISEDTTRIGDEIRTRTAEIDVLQNRHTEVKHVGGSRAQQEFVAKARKIVDSSAQNLGNFVQAMAPSVDEYRTHSRAMFSYLRNGLRANSELGNPPDEDIQQVFERLMSELKSAQDSTARFQASLESVPALTGKFKRARRRAAAILGELIAEMSLTADEALQTLEIVRGPKN